MTAKDNDKPIADKMIPDAKGKQTPQKDFDRNRDGLYGGLPKARDTGAPDAKSGEPQPKR